MIHIVFNTADIETLQTAIELDESLAGEIVEIKDDYAVGPLENIYTAEGAEARRHWWVKLLHGGDYDGHASTEIVNDKRTVENLMNRLDEDEKEVVWIWAGQNKHDVCGYYWLLYHLKPYQGRIYILYFNNLPFINEQGGLFYPTNLHKIPPREFLKAKKLARPITPSEFEMDGDEWNRIMAASSYVRLLEGGKKLSLHPVEFYDQALRKYITGDFTKPFKLFTRFFKEEKETTGDMFLLWRLKQMLPGSGWEVRGETKGMKDFEIRDASLPSRRKVAEAVEEEIE
jgi:hypothetical protein